jgi:hypothetical protein
MPRAAIGRNDFETDYSSLFGGFLLVATDTDDTNPTSTPGCKFIEKLDDSTGYHPAH